MPVSRRKPIDDRTRDGSQVVVAPLAMRSQLFDAPVEIPGTRDFCWAASDSRTPLPLGGRRDVVAVGAALGGLSAVCELLNGLPATFDAAILLALDMHDQPASTVLQSLRGHSRLPVSYADEGSLVRRGYVIVAPVHHHMRVAQPGIITLEDKCSLSGSEPSMNSLFETCADVYGQRVIGVILKGASHESTAGLVRIEAAGGIGIVQDSEEAAEAGMSARVIRALVSRTAAARSIGWLRCS